MRAILATVLAGCLFAVGATAEELSDLRDLTIGTKAADMSTAGYFDFACGTNGGPPARRISGWEAYGQCAAEAGTGLHEVFVRFDDEGRVCGVVEKVPVSDVATVGIYNFAHGSQFLDAARAMIAAGKRVNGEFYVAPCYDELLAAGGSVGVYGVGTDVEGMYGLGTPADLAHFCSLPVRDKAVGKARRALVG